MAFLPLVNTQNMCIARSLYYIICNHQIMWVQTMLEDKLTVTPSVQPWVQGFRDIHSFDTTMWGDVIKTVSLDH